MHVHCTVRAAAEHNKPLSSLESAKFKFTTTTFFLVEKPRLVHNAVLLAGSNRLLQVHTIIMTGEDIRFN